MRRAAAILLCALAALAAHAGIQQMMLAGGARAVLLDTTGTADDCGGIVGWALTCGSIGGSTVTGVGTLTTIGYDGADSVLAISAGADPGQGALGDVAIAIGPFSPVTFDPAAASYSFGSGTATWTWEGENFGFVDDTGFTLRIYAP